MAKKRTQGPEVRVAASAKAELVGKVSYERRKNITEVVPQDVTRAKAGAWLTFISPITEWAGLKGDQLRHKRQLLRIQQEAVLNRIAERAQSDLKALDSPISPVPTKFLVPFLERASLEEDDSELCDRWSDLLVSAATNYDPSMVRFSAVLAEIGAGEVALLHKLVCSPRGKRALSHIEDVPHIFLSNTLARHIHIEVGPQDTEESVHDALIERFEYPGTVWPFIAIGDWDFIHSDWSETEDAIASNLLSLGVLHLIDGVEGTIGEFSWYGRVYALTTFGLRFVFACDRSIKSAFDAICAAHELSEKEAERGK